jgi:hypothetical protein
VAAPTGRDSPAQGAALGDGVAEENEALKGRNKLVANKFCRSNGAMHGVPVDLDLSRFEGATLIQICIGEYQVQFHFHPQGSISIEGKWELRDLAGALLDASLQTNEERDAYRLHVLLGKRVAGSFVNAPNSFSLRFESGATLMVFDESEEYESFSIQPGGIHV